MLGLTVTERTTRSGRPTKLEGTIGAFSLEIVHSTPTSPGSYIFLGLPPGPWDDADFEVISWHPGWGIDHDEWRLRGRQWSGDPEFDAEFRVKTYAGSGGRMGFLTPRLCRSLLDLNLDLPGTVQFNHLSHWDHAVMRHERVVNRRFRDRGPVPTASRFTGKELVRKVQLMVSVANLAVEETQDHA